MKKRKDSFFGLHFDYHAIPKFGLQGENLKAEDIREICQTFHPDFIQIDCKGHPGWSSYPSKLGNAMPEFAFDTLELWRRITKEENVALYMHYSGVYDDKYCAEHPNEVVMLPDGKPAVGATRLDGHYSDDLLIPQLCELVEKYDVDGFWIDGDCWKAQTDFHPETLTAFEQATGIDLKENIPAKRGDAYFEEYREYHRELFRRYVRHYVDAIHKKYPDVQIASNWAFSDHMPEKISAHVDFLSGDLDPSNSLQSARYAARALSQQKFPWDLMSWNFRIKVGESAAKVPKHQTQILQEAASVISLGGGYQNYIMQREDGSPNMIDIRTLNELSKFIRAREPYCFQGIPIHQAALLLSTYDRARESNRLYSRNGYEKIMGLTALLCDVGQSLEIVCEHTLVENYSAYQMIVVPELYQGLDEKTVQLLLEYANHGGRLVLVGRNTCKFFSEVGVPFEVSDISTDVKGDGMRFDIGHSGEADIQSKPYYFTMDENQYGVLFHPCEIRSDFGQIKAYFSDGQDGTKRVLARMIQYGEGCITAIGADLGSQYLSGKQYMHRNLIKTLIDDLYEPIVRIESVCGLLEVLCLEKDGKMMIQLVNVGGSHGDPNTATDDYVPSVLDTVLSLKLPKYPSKIVLQPCGRELEMKPLNGRIFVEIDRIDIHSILQIIT